MNLKYKRRLIIFALIVNCIFYPLYANVDISFETEVISKSNKSADGGAGIHGNVRLLLGKDYFQVSENGMEYIYDFSKHKVFVLDPVRKAYEVHSLYTYSGFRSVEMENRLRVYDIFKHNAKYQKFMLYLTPELIEHSFSLKSARDSDRIVSSSNSGKNIYKTGNTTLFETSTEGKTISKNEANMFSKYMMYRVGGHPEILKKIIDKSLIPDWLAMYSYASDDVKRNIKLVSFKNISDSSYSLDGYKPGALQFSGEFVDYVEHSTLDVAKNAEAKILAIETEIKDSISQKNYLEAILGCMEIGLYSSRFDNSVCKASLKIFQSDEKVQNFLVNINTDEKIKIDMSYQKLKELESFSFKKTYVLWVFEANLKARAGETSEAFNLYYKALKMNPFLTGVYKDIGEIFYSNYNMDMAWFCWDTGRKVYPNHSMLKEIDKLEDSLTKKYPDFF